MYIKKYRMAERVIEIRSVYEKVHQYCQGYETQDHADFIIEITQRDIDFEKKKSDQEYLYEGLPLPDFPPEILEITAVYRKIADQMIQYDTFVFHGSVIAVDGQAYLFTAKSGTGKSTHTRLWRELLGDRTVMVNDDKPLLSVQKDKIIAYGTPYNGKHRLGSNIAVPLKALCILTRAEENHICHITKSQAYAMLVQQVYRPQNPVQMARTLQLIDQLAERVELYQLGCNMNISAAETAYHAMKG